MQLAARPPLARMVLIDDALRAGGYPNAQQLGRQLEVNPRTVRRDIEYLRDRLRAPIAFDPRRNGFYYTEPGFRLPYLQLTEGELVALFLAEQMLRQYRGTSLGHDLARAFEKLTAGLSDQLVLDAQSLARALSFRTTAPAIADAAIVRTLVEATARRQRLAIDYWTASRNSRNLRNVDPHHVASIDGQFYLIAFCHLRGAFRLFVPTRMHQVEPTGETFERDPSFDIQTFLGRSLAVHRGEESECYVVCLRFTGSAVPFVRERQWHPSQELTDTPDGAVLLKFEVSHLREAKRMALTWSPDCEVLAPAELRAEVTEALTQALARHRVPPGQAGPSPPTPNKTKKAQGDAALDLGR